MSELTCNGGIHSHKTKRYKPEKLSGMPKTRRQYKPLTPRTDFPTLPLPNPPTPLNYQSHQFPLSPTRSRLPKYPILPGMAHDQSDAVPHARTPVGIKHRNQTAQTQRQPLIHPSGGGSDEGAAPFSVSEHGRNLARFIIKKRYARCSEAHLTVYGVFPIPSPAGKNNGQGPSPPQTRPFPRIPSKQFKDAP